MAAKWAFANATSGANAAAYYVYDTSGVGLNEVYVGAEFNLCANQLEALIVNGGGESLTPEFWRINDLYGAGGYTPPQTDPALIVQAGAGHVASLNLKLNGNGKFNDNWGGEFGPVFLTADAGTVTVQVHLNISAHTLVYKINGTSYDQSAAALWTDFPCDQVDSIPFGATRPTFSSTASVRFQNFTNVTIGTTAFGSTDLLTTDFSGGTFAAFTGTVGDMTIITSPSCAPVVPSLIVFSNWIRSETSPGGIPPPPPPPTGGGGGGSGPPTGGGGGGGGGGFPVPPSSQNYAAAIAYTANRPAFDYGGARIVEYDSAGDFLAAVADATPGDWIRNVNTTGGQTIGGGQFEGFVNMNGGTPQIVFDLAYSGTANQTKFTGASLGSFFSAVWMAGAQNLQLYGGDISNRANAGILFTGQNDRATQNVTWWGFQIHDVGGSGLSILPEKPATGADGICTRLDLQGTVTQWGQDLNNDPHSEKGTGMHGAIMADVPGATFTNSRVSLQTFNGHAGAGMELGQVGGGTIANLVFNLLADTCSFQAVHQTAGNAFQTWGDVVPTNITIGYLEGRNCQGRCMDAEGGKDNNNSGISVLNGLGFNNCLNPFLGGTEPSQDPNNYWWLMASPSNEFNFVNISPAQIP